MQSWTVVETIGSKKRAGEPIASIASRNRFYPAFPKKSQWAGAGGWAAGGGPAGAGPGAGDGACPTHGASAWQHVVTGTTRQTS